MRYVIVGAGAVGATIGGLLAEAGHEVALVARGAHADVLRSDGLRLRMPDRELHLRLATFTLDELQVSVGDVLVLAVKSQDSDEALRQLAQLPVGAYSAGEVLPVVCAQNGISNEDVALRLFRQVHGASVNVPATHLEPGIVDADGVPLSGVVQLGRYPFGIDETDSAAVDDLIAAGFASMARADVMAWKRGKLLRNVLNAVDVLCGPGARRSGDPSSKQVIGEVRKRAVEESLDCYRAAGLSVIEDEEYSAYVNGKYTVASIEGRARQGSSTWQSIERRQGSVETDYLNGEIVRLGRLHGVATPVNESLQLRMRAFMWTFLRTGTPMAPIPPAELLR